MEICFFFFRSTEEIFALFITFAFSADAIKDTVKGGYYYIDFTEQTGHNSYDITSVKCVKRRNL